MGVYSEWRNARRRRRCAGEYLDRVLPDSGTDSASWLTRVGGRERAASELLLLRRALALIVAERDALDDRTASDVAHCLAPVIAREAQENSETGHRWVDRWREYTAALAVRGSAESPSARLARVLLRGTGVETIDAGTLAATSALVQSARVQANEALRAAFGVASLPDDVRPSAMRG